MNQTAAAAGSLRAPRFAAAATGVMVCTDLAHRGLDLPAISAVVHYHLPRKTDIFVHRSGRTARAQQARLLVAKQCEFPMFKS